MRLKEKKTKKVKKVFEKKFSEKDFEKWIKFQKFEKHKFYVVSVGDRKHEPTLDIVTKVAKNLEKIFPDMAFIVIPNYFKIVGFEPVETTESEQGGRVNG